MPRGASPRREHEYKEIVGKMKKEGEYKGREKQVAARIVNKQRAQAGETKSSRGGKSAKSRGATHRRSHGRRTHAQRGSAAGASHRGSGSAVGAARRTQDHEEIRAWVERHGGCPSEVKSTAKNGTGILRIDFPGYSGQKTLGKISWDEFFNKFDQAHLAFLYQDRTKSGRPSRFNKLVHA